MTAYPEFSPCTDLSILTGSATMFSIPLLLTLSMNAIGKLRSWPNKIPIFFIMVVGVSEHFKIQFNFLQQKRK